MIHLSSAKTFIRRRGRGRFGLVAAAVLAALTFTAGTAHAATAHGIGETTENRPSTVEVGGAEYIAWAGTDSNGEVNVAKLNSGLTAVSDGPWTYGASGTGIGAGVTIAATRQTPNSAPYLVVAYTNGAGEVIVDAVNPNDTGNNWGYECEADVGISTDTPYITAEGDDGTGNLYLAYVNADQNGAITVEQIDPSQCNGSTGQLAIAPGQQFTITSDSSWVGPALIPDGYNGTPGSATLYLAWAGTNSAHNLNIAKYNWGATSINAGDKTVESAHATKTDMGGAYDTATKQNWISYCGTPTSNFVYFQSFSGHAGGNEQSTGARCDVTVFQNTYYSGGVGVGYDYTTKAPWLSYADTGTTINTIEE
jgi:hypothetical protein